jgi:hypothetical protein
MEEDATLDRFAAADDDGEDDADDADGGVETTYRWEPGDGCERCDADVDRLWRDGDEMACEDCKRWDEAEVGATNRHT